MKLYEDINRQSLPELDFTGYWYDVVLLEGKWHIVGSDRPCLTYQQAVRKLERLEGKNVNNDTKS